MRETHYSSINLNLPRGIRRMCFTSFSRLTQNNFIRLLKTFYKVIEKRLYRKHLKAWFHQTKDQSCKNSQKFKVFENISLFPSQVFARIFIVLQWEQPVNTGVLVIIGSQKRRFLEPFLSTYQSNCFRRPFSYFDLNTVLIFRIFDKLALLFQWFEKIDLNSIKINGIVNIWHY